MREDACIRSHPILLEHFLVFRTNAIFLHASFVGHKVIEEKIEYLIQLIHDRNDLGTIEARVAEMSPNDVTVPFFHVPVVVLVIWPRACEINMLFVAPTFQTPVNELRSGIGMHVGDPKREALFDRTEAVSCRFLALVPLRSSLAPESGNIRAIHRIRHISGKGWPTMH